MPRLITGLDAGQIARNLERVREAIADAGRDPATVDILAAVKYVPLEEIGTLHEAGLTLLGENRAQELEDKATLHPDFRWHFIGQLQSRKVKQILPYVELIHSVASESALRQLGTHGTPETEILLEVNVAGEEGKAGIAPDELPRYLELSPGQGRGPDDDAPVCGGSRGQPAAFRPPGRARGRARTAAALDGNLAGLRRRCSGRCNDCADRHDALYVECVQGKSSLPRTTDPTMALSDSFRKVAVYFGLAEDREYYDDDEPEIRERAPAAASREEEERPNVRRLQSSRRRRDEIDDIFGDDSASERRTTQLRPVPTRNGRGEVRVHLVVPKSFNDAQDVADKFKDSIPVIINLQSSDPDLSKRLIDFASGLTYALDGGMQRIADKVFLLTPRNVEVSAEERAALIEKGFFNQS